MVASRSGPGFARRSWLAGVNHRGREGTEVLECGESWYPRRAGIAIESFVVDHHDHLAPGPSPGESGALLVIGIL
jgi:hypothetical protein